MCPKCGKTNTVLQSVVSQEYQCRRELGGCGTVFELPDRPANQPKNDTVRDTISSMQQTIREFEHRDIPHGHQAIFELQSHVDALLDQLKEQIGRLATEIGPN